MENFRVIYPSIALAPYVQRYWILATDSLSNVNQRVIPNGCTELMFNLGDRINFLLNNTLQPLAYIKGQNTNYYDLVPIGKIHLISVAFTPFGAKAFFPIPINEFSNKCIDVNDIGDLLLTDLSKRVSDDIDDNIRIRLIEQFLSERFNPLKNYNFERLSTIIEVINKSQEVNIKTLAGISCLSYRQFIRIFTDHIGMTPKEYLRVIRFQKVLYTLQNRPQISSVDLAFECGYYDQSHLINEFKKFSGYTLTEYPNICEPRSDYFS